MPIYTLPAGPGPTEIPSMTAVEWAHYATSRPDFRLRRVGPKKRYASWTTEAGFRMRQTWLTMEDGKVVVSNPRVMGHESLGRPT